MKSLLDMPHGTIKELFARKRNICNCKKVEFSINSFREVTDVIGDGFCAYTGEAFKDWRHVTFERINPFVGYVPGNVVLVTMAANSHKSTLDAFVKGTVIPDEMKVKLLRKALYAMEKRLKANV